MLAQDPAAITIALAPWVLKSSTLNSPPIFATRATPQVDAAFILARRFSWRVLPLGAAVRRAAPPCMHRFSWLLLPLGAGYAAVHASCAETTQVVDTQHQLRSESREKPGNEESFPTQLRLPVQEDKDWFGDGSYR